MHVAREEGSSRRACRRSNRHSLSHILSEDQDSSLDDEDCRKGTDVNRASKAKQDQEKAVVGRMNP